MPELSSSRLSNSVRGNNKVIRTTNSDQNTGSNSSSMMQRRAKPWKYNSTPAPLASVPPETRLTRRNFPEIFDKASKRPQLSDCGHKLHGIILSYLLPSESTIQRAGEKKHTKSPPQFPQRKNKHILKRHATTPCVGYKKPPPTDYWVAANAYSRHTINRIFSSMRRASASASPPTADLRATNCAKYTTLHPPHPRPSRHTAVRSYTIINK